MLQLDKINDFEWRRLVERLDRGVAESARSYLAQLHARRVAIRAAHWGDELEELRLAREPDYDMPGLPLAYALKYMPRRVISVLGALLSLNLDRYPSRVLDIGSGTGATALALDLLDAPRHIALTGVEPSHEMRAFAGSSRFAGRVTARYTDGSVGADTLPALSLRDFDLLVFSATFPYRFDDWQPLLDAIGNYDSDRMILVVEPDAKSSILDSFSRRLSARGWPTSRATSKDLGDVMTRDDIPPKATTAIWERIGSPGSTPPKTWWNPPDDRYLIANPMPSWPLLNDFRNQRLRLTVPDTGRPQAHPNPWLQTRTEPVR
jgi:SAM-dependent methyltransferase